MVRHFNSRGAQRAEDATGWVQAARAATVSLVFFDGLVSAAVPPHPFAVLIGIIGRTVAGSVEPLTERHRPASSQHTAEARA